MTCALAVPAFNIELALNKKLAVTASKRFESISDNFIVLSFKFCP